MAIFVVTSQGSCTTFVTHTFEVEAETAEEALQFAKEDKNIVKQTTEHDIDDDYSDFNY